MKCVLKEGVMGSLCRSRLLRIVALAGASVFATSPDLLQPFPVACRSTLALETRADDVQ